MSSSAAQPFIDSLPPALTERCRALNAYAPNQDGQFVLYWMHHAVRGHDNPALDVAMLAAHQYQLPLLVYQGLSGNHRFNNDRHHTFILEGARDAHRELTERGIHAVFHLATTPTEPSPLTQLIERSALCITEDYPVPPLKQWTTRLAQQTSTSMLAVDCNCILPMQHQPPFSRAFAFRQANQAQFDRRIWQSWQTVQVELPRFDFALEFEPLDLNQMDIAALCAHCDIDHSVPPVAHTRGGAVAGYQRWQTFKQQGLDGYAQLRNNAEAIWPQGVSRLSAYLHHGHISVFRIAREAAEHAGQGASKFLDELLIWRELSHNLCFHRVELEKLSVLPDWAQQTLHEHASDPRPVQYDRETLARSQTEDRLWNLAQTSLRIHGELHNNLRMTWVKALLPWRSSMQASLETAIELNHRYALDGSDANSYGGLLWAFGLFDRPFEEQPIQGTVRSRSTQVHAKRLHMERYAARIQKPSAQRQRIAVIGAGIAGLSAARTLQDQGHQVQLFEKSRGLGGRTATRRIDDIGYDHGAPCFHASHPLFQEALQDWSEQGLIGQWQPRRGRIKAGVLEQSDESHPYYVAMPGMSSLARHLGHDLNVCRQQRILPLQPPQAGWHLHSEQGDRFGPFDALIVALPAPQAHQLLIDCVPDLAKRAQTIDYLACWTVLADLPEEISLAYDLIHDQDGFFEKIICNSSKPQRQGQTWVLQASANWTRQHLEYSSSDIAQILLERFCQAIGIKLDQVQLRSTHRWLYAQPSNSLGAGALWQAEFKLSVCGDWCLDGTLEGAYLSGQAAAGRLLGELAKAN